MTLQHVITLILNALSGAGAHHPGFGAVSQHLGWVETRHWLIRVCWLGQHGCRP